MAKVKFLLLDDSELILRHISKLLLKEGWEVHTAASLQPALQACARHKPQCLLVDFVLEGGQTGLQAISAIFSLKDLPKPATAIMTLGALAPADEQRASSLGVKVIQKPERGKEADFIERVKFWLHEAKIVH